MNKKEQPVFKKNSFLEKELAAKNRELEIEASLERVREKAMAMHVSAELKEVVQILFEELRHLDVNLQACLIATFDAVTSDQKSWIIHGKTNEPYSFLIPYNEQPFYQEMLKAWKERNVNWSYMLEGEAKTKWENFLFTDTEFKLLPKEVKEEMLKPEKVFFAASYYPYGAIQASSPELLSKASIDILRRFSKVFDSCYTRFLDLKKAEAQAREAQIQLALERVRAKTMAMQKPSGFVDVINVIGEQFIHLGFDFDWVNFSANGLDVSKAIDIWNFVVVPGLYQGATRLVIPFFEHPVFKKAEESVNEYHTSRNSFTVVLLGKKDKDTFLDHLFTNTIYKDLPEEVKTSQYNREVYQTSNVVLKDTWLSVGKYDATPLTDEQIAILKRLANEFGQAYTRFLDLQKAEAQARESQIQLALERVRARTMAMHRSDELREVVKLLYDQIEQLGFGNRAANIVLMNRDTGDTEWWMSGFGQDEFPDGYFVKYFNNPDLDEMLHHWKSGDKYTTFRLTGESKRNFDQAFLFQSDFKRAPEDVRLKMGALDYVVFSLAYMKYGALNVGHQAINEEQAQILQRFATVFEQTYTRFLDLQKAEAQAREAQIEAALEKIRSRSLAMQKSDELKEVVAVLFVKLKELGLVFDGGAAIHLFDENSKNAVIWVASPEVQTPICNSLPYDEGAFTNNPIILDVWKAKDTNIDILNRRYSFEEKNKYFEYVFKYNDETILPQRIRQFIRNAPSYTATFISEKNSLLGASSWTEQIFSEENIAVLRRIARVFEQAYIRFLDLQKAEAQAREAQIEAALERVRSRTLAMQKSDELVETAAVLFKQLIHLGIEPNRLYICIIKDEKGEAEFWITDEDGSKVSLAYYAKLVENPSFKKMFNGWKEKKRSVIIDMQGKELENYFHHLTTLNVPFKSGLAQKRRIQYLAYFNKGFIGMASPEPQPAETLQLLERFAYVFNLTYTRFNDLQIAEAHALQAEQDLIEIKNARRKAEEALTKLQAAQKQLIQSEKMASLGELTAGIAHEIQNPLNFVNNFSEVNREMLEELKTERLKPDEERDDDLQNDLINDVIDNSEKILHHGKRADAIVKGMLQHSRKSSGQKEPTDINALCDEYLRLSYHGLRAKDKTFNATINTNFDRSIGKIDIVAQDIGRVILNLINNAFYACTERSRSSVNEQKSKNLIPYEPAVSLSTKKKDNHVTITVSDNGNGIPQNIVDKIFQPFFTTKPTGEGTGLGLSLAYDIVKAHGGEIKVVSKEGEGSEFVIQLVNTNI